MTLSSSCHVRFLICVLSTLAYVGLSNSQNIQADLQNNTLVITVNESLPNREISTLINSSCQIAESLRTAYKFDLIRWIIIRNSTTIRTVDISTISCRRETSTQSFTIADTVTVKAVVTEPTPPLPTTRTIQTSSFSSEAGTSHHVTDNSTHSSLPTTSAQATNKDATATASFYATTSEISTTPNNGSNSVSTSKIVTDVAASLASTQDASVETTSSNLVPTGVTHSEPEPTTPRSTLISTNKTSTASQTPISVTILDNDTLTSKTITTESASAAPATTKEVTPTTKANGFTDTTAYVTEITSAGSSYVEPSSKSATTTIPKVISDTNLTTALIAKTNTTELITATDIATTPTRTFSGTQTSGRNILTISNGVSDSATSIYETTTASTATSDTTDFSARTDSISVATLNTSETEPTATLESIASTTSGQIANENITSESVPVTESTLRSDVSTGTETGITRTAFSMSEPTHNADTGTATASTSTTDAPTENGTISTGFSTTDTTSGPAVSISSDRSTTSGSTASPTTTSPEETGLYTGTMSIITSSNGPGSESTVGNVSVDSGIVFTDPTTKIASIATAHSEANSMTVSATSFDVSDYSVHTTYPTATPTPGYASDSTTNLNTVTNIFETSSTAHIYTNSADSSVDGRTSGAVTEMISSDKPHVTRFESTVASTLTYFSERTESDEPTTAISTGFTTEAASTVQMSGASTHATTSTESSTPSPNTASVSISTFSTVSLSETTTLTVPTKTSHLITSSVPSHPESTHQATTTASPVSGDETASAILTLSTISSSFDSTTEVTMLTTSTEIPAAGAGADSQGTDRSLSSGEIVAAVLGSLFGTFVIVIAIFFIARQIRRRTSSTRELMNPYGSSNLYNAEIYQPQRPTL